MAEQMNRIPDGTKVQWFDEDFGPMRGVVHCYYEAISTYAVDGPPLGRCIIKADVLHSGNPTKVVRTNPNIVRV